MTAILRDIDYLALQYQQLFFIELYRTYFTISITFKNVSQNNGND